jgi:hypothetical protein
MVSSAESPSELCSSCITQMAHYSLGFQFRTRDGPTVLEFVPQKS